MMDLLLGILATAIWTAGAATIYPLIVRIRETLPSRNLWRFNDPGESTIYLSSTKSQTGVYLRSGTGTGHVRALGLVLLSLQNAYGQLGPWNILLSEDPLGMRIDHDLVLLGGPEYNEATNRVLDALSTKCPARQNHHLITWVDPQTNVTRTYGPTRKGDNFTEDHAIVMRVCNPLQGGRGVKSARKNEKMRTVIILSGCHTYGTLAAARFFTENIYEENKAGRGGSGKYKGDFVAVIRAKIGDGWPTALTEVEYQDLDVP